MNHFPLQLAEGIDYILVMKCPAVLGQAHQREWLRLGECVKAGFRVLSRQRFDFGPKAFIQH